MSNLKSYLKLDLRLKPEELPVNNETTMDAKSEKKLIPEVFNRLRKKSNDNDNLSIRRKI